MGVEGYAPLMKNKLIISRIDKTGSDESGEGGYDRQKRPTDGDNWEAQSRGMLFVLTIFLANLAFFTDTLCRTVWQIEKLSKQKKLLVKEYKKLQQQQ